MCILGNFVKKSIDCVCGFISGLSSVPLVYVSVFMPAPYCFDYYSFVI